VGAQRPLFLNAERKTRPYQDQLGGSRSIQLSYRGRYQHCLSDKPSNEVLRLKPVMGDLVDSGSVRVTRMMADSESGVDKSQLAVAALDAEDHAELPVRRW
jgi:hypothetical protein